MDDPIWISKELALAIQSRQLAEHGGADGIRDILLLESALAHPRQLFAYSGPKPTRVTLAGAYAFAISKNHAFIDGNKRTAAVVCETFLVLNGFELTATDAELYPAYLALASGDLREAAFNAWMAPHVCKKTVRGGRNK